MNSMTTDKELETRLCGNCGWSEPISKEEEHDVPTGPNRVMCTWLADPRNTLPVSIHESMTFMYAHEGYGCKCWKPKE